MNENEFEGLAMGQAHSDIASALLRLELATGKVVVGISLDHTFILTAAGKNRTMRRLDIELSERPGEGWSV